MTPLLLILLFNVRTGENSSVSHMSDIEISCVVDLFAPPDEFEKLQKCLNGVDSQSVILMPSKEDAVMRNERRSERSRLKEDMIRINNDGFVV